MFVSDKLVAAILAARCFPGCCEYILIGRRMRNVTGAGFEGNLFQKNGQLSGSSENASVSPTSLPSFKENTCWIKATRWQRWGSLTASLRSGIFESSAA